MADRKFSFRHVDLVTMVRYWNGTSKAGYERLRVSSGENRTEMCDLF